MAKKKTVLSVTAGAFIASSLVGAQGADASSYKVKSGDNLWSVAEKNNTNVAHLKKVNHLDSDLIFPKQVIKVDGKDSSSKSSTSNESSSLNKAKAPKSSSTYKVESGDTLSQIAADHDTTVDKLMKNNNLDSSTIFPGDKIKVDGSSSSSSSSSNDSSSSDSDNDSDSSSSSSESSSSSSSYTVESGDTLGKVANKENVSVSDLKEWNNISGHLIYPGDKLSLKESNSSSSSSDDGSSSDSNSDPDSNNEETSSSSNEDTESDNDKSSSTDSESKENVSAPAENGTDVVSKANSQVGAPYEWAGATPSGFDCSGFIYWAFDEAGEDVDRLSTDGFYNRSYMIDSPQEGDLVFFENTYKTGISHMGIYVGNNEFVHAANEKTGVTKTSLDNPYWSDHFHSYKRFY